MKHLGRTELAHSSDSHTFIAHAEHAVCQADDYENSTWMLAARNIYRGACPSAHLLRAARRLNPDRGVHALSMYLNAARLVPL